MVDTNIVFSAILNSNGKIGDLLLNSSKYIDFYSSDYLRYEISNHYDKLSQISKQPFDKIVKTEYFITKGIKFISEEQVAENSGVQLMIWLKMLIWMILLLLLYQNNSGVNYGLEIKF